MYRGYVTKYQRVLSTVSIVCFLGNKDTKEKLFVKPLNDWKNMAMHVTRHQKSGSQNSNCSIAAGEYLRVISLQYEFER